MANSRPNFSPSPEPWPCRVPFLNEIEEQSEFEEETTDVSEIAQIQHEFDHQAVNLLFAPTALEQELEVAQALTEQRVPDIYPLAELDLAREQFVHQLSRLKEGDDPTPYVQNFIPALLPVLRTGIQLVGRKRVVDFLAKLLGKLIQMPLRFR